MNYYERLPPESRELVAETLRQRVSRTADSKWRQLWSARLDYVEGRKSEAIASLDHLVEIGDVELRFASAMMRAEFAENEGEFAAALQFYANAEAIKPDSGLLQYQLGLALQECGRSVEGRDAFVRALERAKPEEDSRWRVHAAEAYVALIEREMSPVGASRLIAQLHERFPDAFKT